MQTVALKSSNETIEKQLLITIPCTRYFTPLALKPSMKLPLLQPAPKMFLILRLHYLFLAHYCFTASIITRRYGMW